MYEIRIFRKAKEYLRKLPYEKKNLIIKEIYKLKNNPHSHPKLKPLKGYKRLWKFYIKEDRVIMKILIAKKNILVLAIGHRRNIYSDFFRKEK